ncbi:MAG TPA: hypothetical protein VFY49_06295, partial [Myxococcota bacterium]|nr:hypothetical protein [Myxococcota bacterium]
MNPTHPIVLAHGIARFDLLLRRLDPDAVGPIADDTHYVRTLEGPVHIIAHSMGGLDARHMLYGFRDLSTAACQEFDARVRSFEESCGVLFQTYAGAQPFLRTFAPLKFAWLVIHERDRAHDGG